MPSLYELIQKSKCPNQLYQINITPPTLTSYPTVPIYSSELILYGAGGGVAANTIQQRKKQQTEHTFSCHWTTTCRREHFTSTWICLHCQMKQHKTCKTFLVNSVSLTAHKTAGISAPIHIFFFFLVPVAYTVVLTSLQKKKKKKYGKRTLFKILVFCDLWFCIRL